MIKYIVELRARLIKCLIVLTGAFIICFTQAEKLYTNVAAPLLKQLPSGSTLIATQITSTFLIPMKVSFIVAVLLVIPYILQQLWYFVAPGLYQHEKRAARRLLLVSLGLFYLGIGFAFWVICPLALGFFAKCTPEGVTLMADISHYLDFVITMLLACGFAFQIPIITKIILQLGIVSKASLVNKRPYIIVLAFTLGMLLTPPDVVSQTLLALPIWALFEIGLMFHK